MKSVVTWQPVSCRSDPLFSSWYVRKPDALHGCSQDLKSRDRDRDRDVISSRPRRVETFQKTSGDRLETETTSLMVRVLRTFARIETPSYRRCGVSTIPALSVTIRLLTYTCNYAYQVVPLWVRLQELSRATITCARVCVCVCDMQLWSAHVRKNIQPDRRPVSFARVFLFVRWLVAVFFLFDARRISRALRKALASFRADGKNAVLFPRYVYMTFLQAVEITEPVWQYPILFRPIVNKTSRCCATFYHIGLLLFCPLIWICIIKQGGSKITLQHKSY